MNPYSCGMRNFAEISTEIIVQPFLLSPASMSVLNQNTPSPSAELMKLKSIDNSELNKI